MTSSAASRRRPNSPIRPDDGYEAVSLHDGWGVLSLVCFVLTLTPRYWYRVLPLPLQGWNRMPPTIVWVVAAVAAFGVVLARFGDRRRGVLGKLGKWLNITVLVLSLLLGIAGLMWARR